MARTTLAAFTARIRDDALRFRIDYERAMSRHGRAIEELSQEAWLKAFVTWLRAETVRKRADSIEQTVKQKIR